MKRLMTCLFCAALQFGFSSASVNLLETLPVVEEILDENEGDVAVDGSGNAIAVFETDVGTNSVILAYQPRTGTSWSAQTISGEGIDAERPKVTVNAAGFGIVTWTSDDSGPAGWVEAVTFQTSSSGISVSTPIRISEDNSSNSRACVDAKENGVAIWRDLNNSNEVFAAFYQRSTNTWTNLGRISNEGKDTTNIEIICNEQGYGIAIWNEIDVTSDQLMYARTFQISSSGVDFGSILQVSTERARTPEIGIDDLGNIVITGILAKGTDRTFASFLPRGASSFQETVLLSPNNDSKDSRIAMNGSGFGVIITEDGDTGRLISWTFQVTGSQITYSNPFFVSGLSGKNVRVVVNASGDAMAFWELNETPNDGYLAILPAGSNTWEKQQLFTQPGQEIGDPEVFMNPAGEGVVTWILETTTTFAYGRRFYLYEPESTLLQLQRYSNLIQQGGIKLK